MLMPCPAMALYMVLATLAVSDNVGLHEFQDAGHPAAAVGGWVLRTVYAEDASGGSVPSLRRHSLSNEEFGRRLQVQRRLAANTTATTTVVATTTTTTTVSPMCEPTLQTTFRGGSIIAPPAKGIYFQVDVKECVRVTGVQADLKNVGKARVWIRSGGQGSKIGADWREVGTTGRLNCGFAVTCNKFTIPTNFILTKGNHTMFVSQFTWGMTLTNGNESHSDSRMSIKAGIASLFSVPVSQGSVTDPSNPYEPGPRDPSMGWTSLSDSANLGGIPTYRRIFNGAIRYQCLSQQLGACMAPTTTTAGTTSTTIAGPTTTSTTSTTTAGPTTTAQPSKVEVHFARVPLSLATAGDKIRLLTALHASLFPQACYWQWASEYPDLFNGVRIPSQVGAAGPFQESENVQNAIDSFQKRINKATPDVNMSRKFMPGKNAPKVADTNISTFEQCAQSKAVVAASAAVYENADGVKVLLFRGSYTDVDEANFQVWMTDFVREKMGRKIETLWLDAMNLMTNETQKAAYLNITELMKRKDSLKFPKHVYDVGFTVGGWMTKYGSFIKNLVSKAGVSWNDAITKGLFGLSQQIVVQESPDRNVSKIDTSKFLLSGYSQGGGRASLLSMWLKQKRSKTVETINIAGVGVRCFADRLGLDGWQNNSQITNYVHPLDGIANLDVQPGKVCKYGGNLLSSTRTGRNIVSTFAEAVGYSGAQLMAGKVMGDSVPSEAFRYSRFWAHSPIYASQVLGTATIDSNGAVDGDPCAHEPPIAMQHWCPKLRTYPVLMFSPPIEINPCLKGTGVAGADLDYKFLKVVRLPIGKDPFPHGGTCILLGKVSYFIFVHMKANRTNDGYIGVHFRYRTTFKTFEGNAGFAYKSFSTRSGIPYLRFSKISNKVSEIGSGVMSYALKPLTKMCVFLGGKGKVCVALGSARTTTTSTSTTTSITTTTSTTTTKTTLGPFQQGVEDASKYNRDQASAFLAAGFWTQERYEAWAVASITSTTTITTTTSTATTSTSTSIVTTTSTVTYAGGWAPTPAPFNVATPAPAPPPVPGAPVLVVAQSASKVISGPCTIVDGCARSPNYPSEYGSSQSCKLRLVGSVSSSSMASEGGYDKLTINGVEYSGSSSPHPEMVLVGEQMWSSDASVQKAPGWKVCVGGAGSSFPKTTTITSTRRIFPGNGTNSIKAGTCTIDQAGCALSPNFPAHYGAGNLPTSCNLHMTGVISSVTFATEGTYDTLRVNGVLYSGVKEPPVGLVLEGDQVWTSDASVNNNGWRICTRPNTGGRRLRRLAASAKSDLLISAEVEGVAGSQRSLNVGEVSGDGEVAAASTVSVTKGDSGTSSSKQASTFDAKDKDTQPRSAAEATKKPTTTKPPAPVTQKPPAPVKQLAKIITTTMTTTAVITKVMVVITIKGMDFDKFSQNASVVTRLRKTIKATFLEKLEGYDLFDLIVQFSKGSVKATVDIEPKPNRDPAALKRQMVTNKDLVAEKILKQAKLMPEVKDGSILDTNINLMTAYGVVKVARTDDTTTTTTSTTSTTEKPFGPADLADMDVPNLPTGHPFSGAFATVSPLERAKIALMYAAMQNVSFTTAKPNVTAGKVTDGAPSQGLVLVWLCLVLRLGLHAN